MTTAQIVCLVLSYTLAIALGYYFNKEHDEIALGLFVLIALSVVGRFYDRP
jgi:hypothetical protein